MFDLSCVMPIQVIEPLRSRCLGVRVAAPSNEEVDASISSSGLLTEHCRSLLSYRALLQRKACHNFLMHLPYAWHNRVNATCDERSYPLRLAKLNSNCCLLLQMKLSPTMSSYPFSEDTPVSLADWEIFIQQLAAGIAEEQSTKRLHLVRGKLFELLANCIPAAIIFEVPC